MVRRGLDAVFGGSPAKGDVANGADAIGVVSGISTLCVELSAEDVHIVVCSDGDSIFTCSAGSKLAAAKGDVATARFFGTVDNECIHPPKESIGQKDVTTVLSVVATVKKYGNKAFAVGFKPSALVGLTIDGEVGASFCRNGIGVVIVLGLDTHLLAVAEDEVDVAVEVEGVSVVDVDIDDVPALVERAVVVGIDVVGEFVLRSVEYGEFLAGGLVAVGIDVGY